MMDISQYLEEKRSVVEKELLGFKNDDSIPNTLKDAMAYSLKAGGKRLRPILVMAGADAVGGGRLNEIMSVAVALEIIHTFSLIHDDLPAMDDDSLRRGKPTNHKVFGDAVAILAGDALLAEAFYLLASMHMDGDKSILVDVIRDIASATGARGMTGGQVLDIEASGKIIDENALTKLHLYKTGALITVSAVAGAKICGGSQRQIDALSFYGKDIGLAFQIMDDILDIEGDEEQLGKDIGSDEGNMKSTYPAIIGLEESKRRAVALVESAISTLEVFGGEAEPLRSIAKYIIERKK